MTWNKHSASDFWIQKHSNLLINNECHLVLKYGSKYDTSGIVWQDTTEIRSISKHSAWEKAGDGPKTHQKSDDDDDDVKTAKKKLTTKNVLSFLLPECCSHMVKDAACILKIHFDSSLPVNTWYENVKCANKVNVQGDGTVLSAAVPFRQIRFKG